VILRLMKKRKEMKKCTTANERFGVMAAVARRNGSANLKVCTPQEVQWKPPLRQAAIPLAAIFGRQFSVRFTADFCLQRQVNGV